MKKLLIIVMLTIISGCSSNKYDEYNKQVKRYDKLIEEKYQKAYESAENKEEFKERLLFKDSQIRELQDKIISDKIISKQELDNFTSEVDRMEDRLDGEE